MKNLIVSLKAVVFCCVSTLFLMACDPCSGVVCNNGDCSNGSCVCFDGYQKTGTSCKGVNTLYVGSGNANATQTTEDSSGTILSTLSGIGLTLLADSINPYNFSIIDFNNIAGNDVLFNISSTNYEIVLPTSTPNYSVVGARIGTQVQLDITDASNITYKLAYTVNN